MQSLSNMVRSHEIQSGQTRQDVADIFGVTVDELLKYNKPILGPDGQWNAGVTVRNPAATQALIDEALKRGASAEQLSKALKLPIDVVTSQLGAAPEEQPQDVPEPQPQPEPEPTPEPQLEEITVDARKRGGGSILKDIYVDVDPVLDNSSIRAELSDILDAPKRRREKPEEPVVVKTALPSPPAIDVYSLVGDPNAIINEGVQAYYQNWIDTYGDMDVADIPEEEIQKMSGFFFNAYVDTPIEDIPKNVLPTVMNTLIEVTAKDTKGTYQEWANSIPRPQNSMEEIAYSFLNAIPFYNPTQEDVAQFATASGTILTGLGVLDKRSLADEFAYRVRRKQSDAGLITGTELFGYLADPVGAVGGLMFGKFAQGMMASGRLNPITVGLFGGTLEGASFGLATPVYPEFGDSRILNTTYGAIGGFGLSSMLLSPAIASEAALAYGRSAMVRSPAEQRIRGGRVSEQQLGPLRVEDGTQVTRIDTPDGVMIGSRDSLIQEPVGITTRVPAERQEILQREAAQQAARGTPMAVNVADQPATLDPTPVTLNVKPYVNTVSQTIDGETAKKVIAVSNTDIRALDEQIAQLEARASNIGKLSATTEDRLRDLRQRTSIENKINALKEARVRTLNTIDENVTHNNKRIKNLNKVIKESTSNPSKKGAIPRATRAKRVALQLEKENVLYLTGGNANVDWADPLQVGALRSFANTQGSYIMPPPPLRTGDDVEDAIAYINYKIVGGSKGTRRDGDSSMLVPIEKDINVGFEAPQSLSSAGVRPSVLYADELAARGYNEESFPGIAATASQARAKFNENPEAFTGVGADERTKEEMGRIILNDEATAGQRAVIQAELAGFNPDEAADAIEQMVYRLEGGWDNLEALAARIRNEDIEQGYNSMVEFVMDPANKPRLMSGEITEALQPLWIQAENRRSQYASKLYDLQQEGLVQTEAYVQAVNEYLLAVKVTDVYKAIGRARGQALNQLKKTKQLMEENVRKTKKGIIIDNLLGVKCG